MGRLLLDELIWVSQVLFECGEELAQLSLFKLDISLAERMDEVTDSVSHDLSTLAAIQSLLLNFTDQSFDAS